MTDWLLNSLVYTGITAFLLSFLGQFLRHVGDAITSALREWLRRKYGVINISMYKTNELLSIARILEEKNIARID